MSFMVLTQSKPLEVADSTVSPNVHCVLKNSDFSQYGIHLPEMRGFDFYVIFVSMNMWQAYTSLSIQLEPADNLGCLPS